MLHHPHSQENYTASTLPHYTSQPVQWLRIHHHPRKQSSGLHRYYDVFRCKIKSSHLLYSTQSDQTNIKQLSKPLYVDIVHRAAANSSLGRSDSVETHNQNTLISFHVPFHSRVIGFPLVDSQMQVHYDQIAAQTVVSAHLQEADITVSGGKANEQKKNKQVVVASSKLHIAYSLSCIVYNNERYCLCSQIMTIE